MRSRSLALAANLRDLGRRRWSRTPSICKVVVAGAGRTQLICEVAAAGAPRRIRELQPSCLVGLVKYAADLRGRGCRRCCAGRAGR
jgi:hypothetical protein